MGRTTRKRRRKNQRSLQISSTNVHDKLKSWMLLNNWEPVCDLVPHVFEITGRGLMTLDKIKENQVLIKIPKSLLITSSVVSVSGIQILFSSHKSYSAQCILAAFLIYEKHLGDLSYWKPYLDTLPNCYSNPEFCSKTEKQHLPSFVKSQFKQISQKMEFSYLSLIDSIKNMTSSVCDHCGKSFYDIITFPSYSWAYYTVNTRAIYINDKKQKCTLINVCEDDNLALAPFLDLFNHTSNTVAEANLVSVPDGKDYYQIVALKSYEANEQVFITYGSHHSLKLYLEYGFFIPQNPLDQVVFYMHDVKKCFQVPTSVCNFITNHEFHKGMAFHREGLNYNAKNALFIVTSNTLKEFIWKEKIYQDKFDKNDWQLINQSGSRILNHIKSEYSMCLTNMTKVVHRSGSFSIAVEIVREYLRIIESALVFIKSS